MGLVVMDWIESAYDSAVEDIRSSGSGHSAGTKVWRGLLLCILWLFILFLLFVILGLGWLDSTKAGLIQDGIVIGIILLIQFFKIMGDNV